MLAKADRIGDVRKFIGRCDVCGRSFDGPGNIAVLDGKAVLCRDCGRRRLAAKGVKR